MFMVSFPGAGSTGLCDNAEMHSSMSPQRGDRKVLLTGTDEFAKV